MIKSLAENWQALFFGCVEQTRCKINAKFSLLAQSLSQAKVKYCTRVVELVKVVSEEWLWIIVLSCL